MPEPLTWRPEFISELFLLDGLLSLQLRALAGSLSVPDYIVVNKRKRGNQPNLTVLNPTQPSLTLCWIWAQLDIDHLIPSLFLYHAVALKQYYHLCRQTTIQKRWLTICAFGCLHLFARDAAAAVKREGFERSCLD